MPLHADITRRDALKGIIASALAASLAPSAFAKGANDRLVIGAIGLGGRGGRGRAHAKLLANRKDAHLAYVCDPDLNRAEQAAAEVEKASGKQWKTYSRN